MRDLKNPTADRERFSKILGGFTDETEAAGTAAAIWRLEKLPMPYRFMVLIALLASSLTAEEAVVVELPALIGQRDTVVLLCRLADRAMDRAESLAEEASKGERETPADRAGKVEHEEERQERQERDQREDDRVRDEANGDAFDRSR